MPHRLLGATVVAAVLVLAGCSGDPQPKVADPEPTAASSTEASTPSATVPTEPPLPAAANSQNEAGGEAFLRHWIDLLNYSIESGDVRALDAASAERCNACSGIRRTIEDTYERGGRIKGGLWSVERIRTLPRDRGADYAGYVEGRISEQFVTGVEGRKDASYDSGPGYLYGYAAFESGKWQMVFVEIPL